MISRKYNDESNVVGKVIKEVRESKNMSRAVLSDKLMLLGIDINGDSIYKIENGRRIIKDFELCALSIVLEIPESKLLENCRKELLS